MAAVVRWSDVIEAFNGSTTLTLSLTGSGITAGDLIVAFAHEDQGGFHDDATGFSVTHTGGTGSFATVAEALAGNAPVGGLYIKEATGNETAVVWNQSGGGNVSLVVAIIEEGTYDTDWIAAGKTAGVDYSISVATGNVLTATTITPAQADTLGLCFYGSNSDTNETPTSTWTELEDETNGFVWAYLQSKTLAASATGSVSVGTSAFGGGVTAILVGIPPAGGGGTEHDEIPDDDIGITDTSTASKAASTTLDDDIGVTDTITSSKEVPSTATDVIGLTDATEVVKNIVVTVVDDIGITDTADATTEGLIPITVTDIVGITDEISMVVVHDRTVVNPIGITDALVLSKETERDVVDIIGLIDAVEAAKSITLTIVNGIGITDVTESATSITITVVDQVGVTDQVTRVMVYDRSVVDVIGITDTVSEETQAEDSVNVTDPIGITDVAERALVMARGPPADSIGITDTVQTSLDVPGVFTDVIGITDVVVIGKSIAITVTDVVGITDTASETSGLTIEIVDVIGITDVATRTTIALREITDSIGITDSVTISGVVIGSTAGDVTLSISSPDVVLVVDSARVVLSVSTTYDVGDQPTITALFTDIDGNPADPTAITVRVRNPDGTIVEYDETDLNNPAVGTWTFTFPAPLAADGPYIVKFFGTETVIAAEDIRFVVTCSEADV